MINLFLKAKHWHLFVLMVGIPFISYIAMVAYMISTVVDGNPDISGIYDMMWVFSFIMMLVLVSNYYWLWAIAIGLQKRLPEDVTMNVVKFKLAVFFPLVYMLLIVLAVVVVLNVDMSGFDSSLLIVVIPFAILTYLLMIFCSFYTFYFVAKVIKTALLQRETSISEVVEEIILLWFYPVGLWILQPKINRLIEEERLEDI